MGTSGTTSPSPEGPRGRALPEAVLAGLLGVAALAGAGTLLCQFGQLERAAAFKSLGSYSRAILCVQAIVVCLFAADRVIRLLAAANRAQHLGANWFDLALPACVAAIAAGWPAWRGSALGIGALYVLITQSYTAVAAIVRRTARGTQQTLRGSQTAGLLLGGLAFLCLMGSLLLFLPAAVSEDAYFGWDYVDALFTSVSAITCT
ncbi:MAG: hypothetical protein WCK05_16295, partial [Planctomycetota bacterium]